MEGRSAETRKVKERIAAAWRARARTTNVGRTQRGRLEKEHRDSDASSKERVGRRSDETPRVTRPTLRNKNSLYGQLLLRPQRFFCIPFVARYSGFQSVQRIHSLPMVSSGIPRFPFSRQLLSSALFCLLFPIHVVPPLYSFAVVF